MKKISYGGVFLCLLLLLTQNDLHAQSAKYKIGKVKCVKVEITDPGEFYSTYEFLQTDLDQLRSLKFTEAEIENIKHAYNESAWPSELGNFEVRIQNAEKIKTYTVYKIAEIGDKYLLVAPAKYNSGMGTGWAPQNDIYFVIGKAGVKI